MSVDTGKKRVNIVLFTGRPAGWEDGADSVKKHIIDRMEAVTGCPVLVFASLHRQEDGSSDESNARFADFFNPVRIETFCYKPLDLDHPSITTAYDHAKDMTHRTSSMFYHMKNAFSMAEKYLSEHPELEPLYVLRTRPDIICFTDMEIEPEPEPDMVYVPTYMSLTGLQSGYPHDWLPDHTGYGSFDVMKQYCSIHDIIYQEFVPIYLPEMTLMDRLVKHGGLRWKPVLLGNWLTSRDWRSIVYDAHQQNFIRVYEEHKDEAKHNNFGNWWPGW